MKILLPMVLAVLFVVSLGCGGADDTSTTSKSIKPDARYVLDTDPGESVPVGTGRKEFKDGQEVTLVGRVGGSAKPFVDGIAAFTVVDEVVPICEPDCGCPTPWDYCCETNAMKENIATIKIVTDDGKAVASDARSLLGVKELDRVVVQGVAKRDEAGNLSILAKKVFVRPAK